MCSVCVTFCPGGRRYFGEEENGSGSKENLAQVLLADLRQKAKEKQKRRSAEHREHRHEEPVEKAHPKKKRKADVEPQHLTKRPAETAAVCVAEENRKKGANTKQEDEVQSGGLFINAFYLTLTHNHTVSSSGFSILSKDSSACSLKQPRIEPAAL